LSHKALDARATPGTRDGHARAQPLPTDGEKVPARRLISPCAELPESPEVEYARQEAIEQFSSSLRGNERAVFDLPFSESPAVVAQRVGTDANTVKTTRYRLRKKAMAWGADEQDGGRAA
jgi:hypothetical protein